MYRHIGLVCVATVLFLAIVSIAPFHFGNQALAAGKFSKEASKLLRDIHPSFLGAVGTGEELARHAPTIMNRLRQTRQAIEALGSDDAPDGNRPAAVIKDKDDRRRLERDLKNLEYLVGLLRDAGDDRQKLDAAKAIQRKLNDIDNLYVKWTGRRPECRELDKVGGCDGFCKGMIGDLGGKRGIPTIPQCIVQCRQESGC